MAAGIATPDGPEGRKRASGPPGVWGRQREESRRVMEATPKVKKVDIAVLEPAYDNEVRPLP